MSIEKRYVQDVYNNIASHFSNTRAYQWPAIKKFIDSLDQNSLIADIGCGNGKNMVSPKHQFVGLDFSEELAKICRSREENQNNNKHKNEAIVGNNLQLPLRSNIFDCTISIAVIHHLSSPESRKKCIDELVRITRKNGFIFIQVWAFEGKKYTDQDAYVDWKLQKTNKVYKRYYHLFTKNELEKMVITNRDIVIEKRYEERGNYIVILRKLGDISIINSDF